MQGEIGYAHIRSCEKYVAKNERAGWGGTPGKRNRKHKTNGTLFSLVAANGKKHIFLIEVFDDVLALLLGTFMNESERLSTQGLPSRSQEE